jgi:DNA-binding CsgD family transcriptional regulator
MTLISGDKCESLLSSLTKTVFDAPSSESFLNFLCVETFSSLGASGVILGQVRKQGILELVGTFGYGDKSVEPFTEMPLWINTPITDCVRNREMLVFKSYEELIAIYPDLAAYESNRRGVTASIPIISNNVAIGALGISCSKFPDFSIFESDNWHAILDLVGIYLRFIIPSQQETQDFSSDQFFISERQGKIIEMFYDGLTAEAMANKLNVSVPTVKADITKIFKTFNSKSRQEVVELYRKVFDQRLNYSN